MTATNTKPARTRNAMSDLTVGRAFDLIRARKATLREREAEHVALFRTAEQAWNDKTISRVPQEKRAGLQAAIKAAETEEA